MGILQKKLIIIIVLACGILAYSFQGFWQKSVDDQARVTVLPPPGNATTANTTTAHGTGSDVVVYVSGGVIKPGVYKLSHGSRVVDAVAIAGGFSPGADAARINLALQLKDEMQVNVPYAVTAVSTPGVPAGSSVTSTTGDRININTASKVDLDKLPGIGPALAERIIEYRTTNGAFKDLTDIKNVPGIGESKYNQFKDKISL
ncbi:ComEA family DNA-binding protein [Sporomusa sp.]|uniref:ComEA family DNA-binding protein n=1 Tax=Sporomusa sp. TaxID=2078658 RepID=UPI002BD36C85|nr:ComEA family DNA-binding protein [Sporomusa sp.]HWR06802.1 ComEA family DNA-binding protein [Sporomusa sp.]